jgi:hypothetical protein
MRGQAQQPGHALQAVCCGAPQAAKIADFAVSQSAWPASALNEQVRRNRATRGHWQLFAGHRQQVTRLLLAAAQRAAVGVDRLAPRLCVLGAGNCNDLDLARLLPSFSAIQLVDWDAEALAEGVEQQGLAGELAIIQRGAIDLASAQASEILTAGERVEVAASVCLISQILESSAGQFGAGHGEFFAARDRHLDLLVDLLIPGGCGVLITDVVSSETLPQLLTAQEVAISHLVAQAIAARNFFSGLNPAVVLDYLARGSPLSSQVEQIEPISPWRWDLGSRVYAVYALRFRRR